jgi:hypothetical protein
MVDHKAPLPFRYPESIAARRHGPQGYADASRYKPWLRDEYAFRCVYCLTRERWYPEGDDAFSVEHREPTSTAPDEALNYDNLLYACCRCNATRRDLTDLIDPRHESLAEHLTVDEEGVIHSLTTRGAELIHACQLDRPRLTEFRYAIMRLLSLIEHLDEVERKVYCNCLPSPN